MRVRLGGWLIVGGGALVTVAIWMYADGQGLGFGAANASGLLISGALALFALGAIILCTVGPDWFGGPVVRVGLGLLAVGQLSLLAQQILFAVATSDPMPNPPLVGLLDLVAGTTGGLGLVLTALGLVRLAGWSRAVGAVLLAGALILGTLAFIAIPLRMPVPGHTVLVAIGVAIAGNVGVGLLAIRGRGVDRLAAG